MTGKLNIVPRSPVMTCWPFKRSDDCIIMRSMNYHLKIFVAESEWNKSPRAIVVNDTTHIYKNKPCTTTLHSRNALLATGGLM